jgi:predicted dienelactone hydrolase
VFGKKKIVVKVYRAKANANIVTLPLKAPIAMLTLGHAAHLTLNENQAFEQDAKKMAKQGYSVRSVNNGGGGLHPRDLTVTYILMEKPADPHV